MPEDIYPRPGLTKYRLHCELVAAAGHYRDVERLPDGGFRVPDVVAQRWRDRGGGGQPGGGGPRGDADRT